MVRSFEEVERYSIAGGRGTDLPGMGSPLARSGRCYVRKGITMGQHPKTLERDYFLRYGGMKSANDGFLGISRRHAVRTLQ